LILALKAGKLSVKYYNNCPYIMLRIRNSIFFLLTGFIFHLLLTELYAQESSSLEITNLTGDFYVYTTFKPINGKPFPSNSMYVVTDAGVVMFDTPWDTAQFQPLMDSIKNRHNKDVVLCIPTHYHDDRTAGLNFLKQYGIKTYSSKLTYDLCAEHGENQAENYFVKDTVFFIGNHTFETYYPGEGHTRDNIVIWFSNERILYGGCLVKSTDNSGLGNIADANLLEWPRSIKNILDKYGSPEYVIPGHFSWSNNKSLEHTIKLLEEKKWGGFGN
jgi:glyoxylase-like metal-dependent hydrolase (beta-lactamase superfamily II)